MRGSPSWSFSWQNPLRWVYGCGGFEIDSTAFLAVIQVQIETIRIVMSTVMDSFNNFLNATVLFRFYAEKSKALSAKDLAALDKAMEEAQDRLVQISETEEMITRDLGAVKVIKLDATKKVRSAKTA